MNILKKNSNMVIWLILIALSAISAFIGEFSQSTDNLLPLLLILLIIKSQLIIDYFMQLKQVNVFWRYSMSAFSITISVIIWAVF